MDIKIYEKENEYYKSLIKDTLGYLYDHLKEARAVLAGGAINSLFTNREINDYDIYFRDNISFKDYMVGIGEQHIKCITNRAMLTHNRSADVQYIYFDFFPKIEDIFEKFDFVCCMGAFDFETEKFYLHENFLEDCASRRITFNPNTAYPVVSAMRMLKYVNDKGYTIDKKNELAILLKVSDTKIETFEQFSDVCGGMYGEEVGCDYTDDEKSNFNVPNAIDKLLSTTRKERVKFDEDMGKCKWEETIYDIAHIKPKAFKYRNKWYYFYTVDDVNELDDEGIKEDKEGNKTPIGKYEVVSFDDVFKFPMSYYKVAEKTSDENVFISRHDNSFKYRIGEHVIPANPNSSSAGIYGCVSPDNARKSFGMGMNSVVLRLVVESVDDMYDFRSFSDVYKPFFCSDTLRAKKAFVAEEIKEDNGEKDVFVF